MTDEQIKRLILELRAAGIKFTDLGGTIRLEGPPGCITEELKATLRANATRFRLIARGMMRAEASRPKFEKFDPQAFMAERGAADLPLGDDARIEAMFMTETMIGDLWVVTDLSVLEKHPEIVRSGLPILSFTEWKGLQGKTPDELRRAGFAVRQPEESVH